MAHLSDAIDRPDEENFTRMLTESIEISMSFVAPLVLRAAVLLDIPDIIWRRGTTLSLSQIAAQLPSNAPKTDDLFRLIRCLVLCDFLSEITVEPSSGDKHTRYGLTRISRFFVKENSKTLAPVLLMATDKVFLAPWLHLNEVILGGGYAFEKAHGKRIWDYVSENPESNKVFNDAMAAISAGILSVCLDSYNGFKDIKKLVDVGGGIGASLSSIVAAYPHIQGINYDLPHVVQSAPSISGIEHVGGDMFESVPSGDAIFMKGIMHDWDYEKCTVILQNVHKALPHNGKVIIVDAVLSSSNERTPLNRLKATADILMIAHTTGGKERTMEEWQKLLSNAGFSRICFVDLGTLHSIIEAYKAPLIIS